MNTDIETKRFIFPGLFLIASLFFYPLLLPYLLFPVAYHSYFIFFTSGTLSLLALALCCLKYRQALSFCQNNFFPTMLIGIIFIVCLWHYLLIPNYTLDYFFSSLVWVSVPFFVAVNHKFFEKYLPYFLALLAFWNFVQSTKEIVMFSTLFGWCNALQSSHPCGISGNWNWNGALLVISTPFLMLLITKLGCRFKWNLMTLRVINVFIAALACYYIYLCDSKGIWCALIMAVLFYLGILYRNKYSTRLVLLVIMVVLIAAVIFLYCGGIAKFGAFMMRDVRMQLWAGTLQLAGDNIFSGVGQPLFESAYASYKPVEYYLNLYVTDRSPDPHNHLLFFLVSNGIFAFIAWLILLVLPIWKWALSSTRSVNLPMKLYFFIMLFLFFHGLFDMTLEIWPMNIIFLVTLGIFWGRYWKIPANSGETLFAPWTVRITAVIGFTILLTALAVQLYRNSSGSYYFREAHIARELSSAEAALACYDKSISIKPTPESIYQAALIAFYDLKNPALCQLYLDRMEDLTAFRNYVNNNGLKAKALYLQGRRLESLKYFQQETRNFPLSSVNWYFYYKTLKETGLNEEAVAAYDKLSQSLAVKGLRFEHIPLLIKNPRWDMHFREVPGVDFKGLE